MICTVCCYNSSKHQVVTVVVANGKMNNNIPSPSQLRYDEIQHASSFSTLVEANVNSEEFVQLCGCVCTVRMHVTQHYKV